MMDEALWRVQGQLEAVPWCWCAPALARVVLPFPGNFLCLLRDEGEVG